MNSKQVKKFCQQFDPNCRAESINGIKNGQRVTHYIRVWGDFTAYKQLRILALRTIYGDKFEIDEQAIAGNVSTNHISMNPTEWERLIEWWERLQSI